MTQLLRLAVLIAGLCLVLASCKEGGGGGDGGAREGGGSADPRAALVAAVATCVQGAARDFQARAGELDAALAAGGALEPARAAFHSAMDAWQVNELLQIGPAASSTLPGGQDLREHIYSWPLVSPCAIEETLVSRGYTALPSALVNRRGLAALEYLLFTAGEASHCPDGPRPGWAALAPDEREQRRRAYAAAAAADVRARASALADAWGPGGFAATLSSAGDGNRVFPNARAALNAIFAALLYADTAVKDLKLGGALSASECRAPTCPESRFARRTKANVRANIAGLRRVLEGCEAGYAGQGFDDLLEAVGAGPLAARLRERGAAATAALEAIEEPDLPEAAAADPASVRALHTALKGITDLMKVDFRSVLDLELPKDLEGDND